jgi:hypothetical protein
MLEYARTQWWRTHRPLKYLLQSTITLARHFLVFAVLLVLAAIVGINFADLYQWLPFDLNRPSNFLTGGGVVMGLGVAAAFAYAPRLKRNSDRALARSAELIAWLLEQERAQAEGVMADEPESSRLSAAPLKAQ